MQIMTRLFYIVPLAALLLSCSSNTPVRYTNVTNGDTALLPFLMQGVSDGHDLFSAKVDSIGHVDEISYSFIRHSGDSAVWEEGMIRFP